MGVILEMEVLEAKETPQTKIVKMATLENLDIYVYIY